MSATSPTLDHTESAFERLIVSEMLASGGWVGDNPGTGAPSDWQRYDAHLGLYPDDLLAFVRETQPKKWARLVAQSSGVEAQAEQSLLRRVAGQLDRQGTVELLRRGVGERGTDLRLCFFEPELKVDPETLRLYGLNRLRVVRQVRFDPRKGDSLDLVLFVNGLPTATAELKNRYTGQTVDHALAQYREDRPADNVLLGRRAFVHFALDADLAYMTTRLAGATTRFLPFNQGSGGPGRPGGKGNPPAADGGHPTSYVWREVWQRDAWLELIERFVFVEGGDAIFPRFHQWHVVRACAASARDVGAGRNYLIQHSAGSGKSKEIAWLAHDLSTLHGAGNRQVFDKVIVITDRRVLDQQLQHQVKAFEQVRGMVEQITEDSAQLRAALEGEQARVIITTLQKFPYVLAQLDEAGPLKERSYAVIVDEAHSSQTGEAATDLKKTLGARTVEDLGLDPDETDGVPGELLVHLAGRGAQPNLSFFAFTATPKPKTLELFGEKGRPLAAFHTYSMRQAIEEGFILDVLANYTTYEQLYRLANSSGEALEVPKGKAQSRMVQFAHFHPYAKDQKAQVIVEHFRSVVARLLGGEAKAMVVTASREEAVRYKQALDAYIARHGVADLRTLVAFSGEVTIKDRDAADVGESYTEPRLNAIDGEPLPERRLPEVFDTPGFQVLIVAEKYQTGFDQPKLVAMYVDKRLMGVNAVQTLSRLNRMHPGKEQTYVLDFSNTAEDIREAFEPFYEATEATPSDPNVLFDAARKLRDFDVISDADLDRFAEAYFAGGNDHAALSGATQAAFDTARELEDVDRFAFREALDRFTRFYAFLAQVQFVLPDTEKLYVFARFLALRLRERAEGGALSLSGLVELTHYRLEEAGTMNITLGNDDIEPGTAISGDGTGRGAQTEIPMGALGALVELFNDRYGSELSDADAIRPIQQIVEKVAEDPRLRDQALANDFDDFERGKEGAVINATLQVKDINDLILQKMLDDQTLRERATHLVMRSLYDRYHAEAAGEQ